MNKKRGASYISTHLLRCIADCDQCGNCQVLHHQEAELVFADYIEGRRSYLDIMMELR